jgi:prolipoprotein diacylglyceryl transferase
LAGVFIRLGNLFNSEIIGTPTEVPWAFVFTRVDLVPRHPSQLYEAVWYLVVFVVLFRMWNSTKVRTPHGRLLGVFLIMVFGGRFAVEMLKENQVGFEDSLALNMGQILSIPAVLGGLFLLLRHRLAPNSTPGGGHE